MVIQFSHPKARKYLLENGEVYTFRMQKRKRVGKNWASKGRGKAKIADVDITFVDTIERLILLKPYISKSGFNSLDEWIKAIINVNPRFYDTGFLYHVKVLEAFK